MSSSVFCFSKIAKKQYDKIQKCSIYYSLINLFELNVLINFNKLFEQTILK